MLLSVLILPSFELYTVNKEYELYISSLFMSLSEDKNAQEKKIYI